MLTVFCSQFLCKWMINFHNRRLWLGWSCVGRSGFHGPDLRWKMDGGMLSCPLIGHSLKILNSDWLSSDGEYMRDWWLARVSYSWFYSLSRLSTVGLDSRVSPCSPPGQLTPDSLVMVSRSKAQQHVITPHKRRGPIAAEFSSPGPASVKLPGLFGCEYYDAFTVRLRSGQGWVVLISSKVRFSEIQWIMAHFLKSLPTVCGIASHYVKASIIWYLSH